jgi:hypothetical protein
LNDDKYKEQLERYKQEQHSKKYYNKEKHKEYIKQHRRYKQNLYLKGEIKKESEVKMIIKTGSNNLDCLVWIEKLNNKYFYVDDTKGIYKEIKKEEIDNYISEVNK